MEIKAQTKNGPVTITLTDEQVREMAEEDIHIRKALYKTEYAKSTNQAEKIKAIAEYLGLI